MFARTCEQMVQEGGDIKRLGRYSMSQVSVPFVTSEGAFFSPRHAWHGTHLFLHCAVGRRSNAQTFTPFPVSPLTGSDYCWKTSVK